MAQSQARPGSWRASLKKLFPGLREDEPLERHTTFRIGGPAEAFLEVTNLEELARFLRWKRTSAGRGVGVFLLGWGSNLLVRERGVAGVTLRLAGEFEKVRRVGKLGVEAGAALRLQKLAVTCAGWGLAGAEPLVGVPGVVGGSLVMNAGTRHGEIGDLVRAVRVFDRRTLKVRRLPKSKIVFRYRHSNLEGYLIVGAELQLKAGDKTDIMRRIKGFQQARLDTQPVHSHNVGSVFTNPPGDYAARLIESVGLKGTREGGARFSPKHANFIENTGGATATDVLTLVERARREVKRAHGVSLKLEMKVVGR